MELPRGVKLLHASIPDDPYDGTDGTGERREEITHNYNHVDIPTGSKLLALISRDDASYNAVAVAIRAGKTSTYQSRLKFQQISRIQPVKFTVITETLTGQLRKHAHSRL